MQTLLSSRRHSRLWRGAVLTVAVCGLAARADGQGAPGLNSAGTIMWAGGELDNYLRYLQTFSAVDTTVMWTVRAFSPADAQRAEAVHGASPWGARLAADSRVGAHSVVVTPFELATRVNTGYPFGGNDGPVWAGRGLTTSLQGGVAVHAGVASVVIAPMVFRAENSAFELQSNGLTGPGRFNDADFPLSIDRPQRFGSGPYTHFDWGETTVRIDVIGLSAGVTTANQWWGPATVYPFLISNNAAGVPHAFLGTQRPVPIYIGDLQARVIYGLEEQSAFSPVQGSTTFRSATEPGTRRFASGLILAFRPGAIPTLELGAARYFHQAWSGHVTSADLRAPFQGLALASISRGTSVAGEADAQKNQLASVFARWTAPHSGFETYFEYGHEDFNYDLRDLLEEPDHSRTALLGFRKAFRSDSLHMTGLRAEVFDATAPTLSRHREEGLVYPHVLLRQGHTEEGQLLGADAGVGSMAGAVLAVDRYSPTGRTTVYLQHTTQAPLVQPGFTLTPPSIVTMALGLDHTTFLNRVDFTTGGALVYQGKAAGGRGFNLSLTAQIRTRTLAVR